MKTMINGRRVTLAVIVMGLMIGGWSTAALTTFEFQPTTKISIKGTSTMHDFECEAGVVNGAVELPGAAASDASEMLASLQAVNVSVPVEKIDCGNGTMDKKMRAALESGKAPLIKYALKSAKVAAANADGYHTLNTTGMLSIAGTERPIEMTVLGKPLADGRIEFTGSKTIKMTDWGVRPPSAMLGTIKTGEDVTVSFQVIAAN